MDKPNFLKRGVATKLYNEALKALTLELANGEPRNGYLSYDHVELFDSDPDKPLFDIPAKQFEAVQDAAELVDRHGETLLHLIKPYNKEQARHLLTRIDQLSYLRGALVSTLVAKDALGFYWHGVLMASLQSGTRPPFIIRWLPYVAAALVGSMATLLLMWLFG
jgi:hypothetical protein